MLSLRPLLALAPLLVLLALPVRAQEAPETAPPAAEEPAAAPAPLQEPTTVEEALAHEPKDLAQALEGREEAELERLLKRWMELLARQQKELGAALEAEEGSEQHKQAVGLGTDRDELIAQAEILIAAVADAGGEVQGARERIAAIRQAEAKALDSVSTVPADQSKAQDLDLEILRAELRPLTKAQVEEQLQQWMALLQKKCLDVRRVEVAALQSEDSQEIARFNERGVELRGERGRLIERVKVVISALEKKSGDVEEARAYLKSVVVAPPVTGLNAAWTTTQTWLTNPDGGIALGLRLGRALVILALFVVLSRMAGRLAGRAMRSMRKTSGLLREFINGSVRKVVFFLGLVIAAAQLGINMGPLLAAIGAAGLVIGLALQGTLSNFASGLLIMVYRPFDVGDVIDAGGTGGKVEGMTLVNTLIKTFDNRTIYVPNNKVWGDVITNVTANPTRRVDLTFGIGYGDDVERAKELLTEIAKGHEKVLAEPEPTVQLHALGDSSVDFIVRPWTRTEDYWAVYWDLTRTVKKRFDEEGISIPFPQRDVHLYHHGSGDGDEVPRPAAAPAKGSDKAAEKVG